MLYTTDELLTMLDVVLPNSDVKLPDNQKALMVAFANYVQQKLQQRIVSGSLPDEVTIKAQAIDYAKTFDDDSSYNVQKKQAFEAGVKWLADLLMNDVRQ